MCEVDRAAGRLNAALIRSYEAGWPRYADLRRSTPGLSVPHLISVPSGYTALPVRLMVVGQWPLRWGEGVWPWPGLPAVEDVLTLYREFELGRNYRSTPFWRAAKMIHRALNGADAPAAFLWSNLVKADVNGARPPIKVLTSLGELGWLSVEIELCRPEVIVFFTHPRLDPELRRQFPEIEFAEGGTRWQVVTGGGLPTRTVRTWHPYGLLRHGEWEAIENLAESLRSRPA